MIALTCVASADYDWGSPSKSGHLTAGPMKRCRTLVRLDLPAIETRAKGKFRTLVEVTVGESIGGNSISAL